MKTLKRQIAHWLYAAESLAHIENMASTTAWEGLQPATALLMKNYLNKNISNLVAKGKHLQQQLQHGGTAALQQQLRKAVLRFKADYLRIETTIHFYTDAINTRTVKETAMLLKGCDELCRECMQLFLPPQQKAIPPVITYMDKGLGAAIMKAGLRVWDGSISPAALIKITYHNLRRPTAVLHECGHQIAHLLNWNAELSKTLYEGLKEKDETVAKAFSKWSSEIAADAIALTTTGFAAVAALHDVLDAEGEAVFYYDEGDPHPVSFLRVLLNCALCTCLFGKGPWNEMELQWQSNHPLIGSDENAMQVIKKSIPLLPQIATLILKEKQHAFGDKSIAAAIDINKVSPATLGKMNEVLLAHPGLVNEYSNLQVVALTGYKIGTGLADPEKEMDAMKLHLIKMAKQYLYNHSQN